MTEKIGVFSAKGGSGKTTTALHLANAFQLLGKNVLLIDGDFRMPNLGAYFGVQMPLTLHDVLQGKKHITEAIYTYQQKLPIIFGSIHVNDMHISSANFSRILYGLDGLFDIIVVDSGSDFHDIVAGVDRCYVVTTPDMMSVVDALRTIRLIEYSGKGVDGVIVNKMREESISLQNIVSILGRPILGVIPEDISIQKALQEKSTVFLVSPNSEAALAYKRLANGVSSVVKVNKLDSIFKFLGLK